MIYDGWLLPPPAQEAYNYAPLIFASVLLVCLTILAVAWMRR